MDIKPNEGQDIILYYIGKTFILESCIILMLLLLLLLLIMLMLLLILSLMPMLMMLALTLLLLPYAFKAVAYVVDDDDVDAESKMLNFARHLVGANVVMLLLILVVILIGNIISRCFVNDVVDVADDVVASAVAFAIIFAGKAHAWLKDSIFEPSHPMWHATQLLSLRKSSRPNGGEMIYTDGGPDHNINFFNVLIG